MFGIATSTQINQSPSCLNLMSVCIHTSTSFVERYYIFVLFYYFLVSSQKTYMYKISIHPPRITLNVVNISLSVCRYFTWFYLQWRGACGCGWLCISIHIQGSRVHTVYWCRCTVWNMVCYNWWLREQPRQVDSLLNQKF